MAAGLEVAGGLEVVGGFEVVAGGLEVVAGGGAADVGEGDDEQAVNTGTSMRATKAKDKIK